MAKENQDEINILEYVSNLDKDVYIVKNLPEEVIAVIFAYVSRSPKSFRDNISTIIKEEQLGQDRASKFHEKWVLNYGHASVAEHACIHIGIENVSRLFSSLLELSNEFLSFTEYSQRYQKPKRGNYHIPDELLDHPSLLQKYKELCNFQYDTYLKLNNILLNYLKDTTPASQGIEKNTHIKALEKLAFEDARYALGLSTYTNLGMTANARAIEDSLTKLLSSPYSEARKKAEEIKQEVRFSVPTLIRYAEKNEYLIHSTNILKKISTNLPCESSSRNNNTNDPSVALLDYTGKGSENPEMEALKTLIVSALHEYSHCPAEALKQDVENLTYENLKNIFKDLTEKLGKYDNPLNCFKFVKYTAEFTISEACWHQLLRHRKINWIPKEPSVCYGITIPPNISAAGATDILSKAIAESENMFYTLRDNGLTYVAHYVVTNAHRRKVIGNFDLWELYHLINLRMSKNAQWDIKNVIKKLSNLIKGQHSILIEKALARVQTDV